ncbi:MAG: transcriptional regulator [Flavobacteriaceae bacterium]|nr:transcriptional regulator [Flavobacteriaceae bacterium]|tara:strand:- start:6959 stop:7378 length:420 start_codon:yes stop_codon:yes gene_type:complete
MVNSKEFAKRIEKILDFYGLSATAFSDAIEFNRSTISHILSGRNKPSLDFVMKVVQEFPEVELYWLLKGKGSFPPSESSPEKSLHISASSEETHKQPKPSEETQENTLQLTEDPQNKPNDDIDRIVVFYKNGHFKSYRP